MRIEINLQEGLAAGLKDKVRRQVAFKLGNKAASVEHVRVSLKTLNLAEDQPWYVCDISAKLKNGKSHSAQLRNRQPNICIADTTSRLARSINRETQLFSRPGLADTARS